MANHWTRTALILALLAIVPCIPVKGQTKPEDRITETYLRAEALVRNRQWDDGLTLLAQVLAAEPRNLKAMNLAGIASAAKGETQIANQYFERCLSVDPHFLPALRNLSINEFNTQDESSAERHLQVAQQQLPNDPTINFYLGRIAYRQQKYALAVERLDRAGSLLARSRPAQVELVVSLLRTAQTPRALDLLSRLPPGDLETQLQMQLGLALTDVDRSAEAVPYLQAAFSSHPDSYNMGFDLALVCVHASQYDTAIQTIKTVLDHAADTSELENLLAEALVGRGDPDKAADEYRRAIALDPKDENNYLDFASLCIDHHAYDDGMKVIVAGLQLDPRSERLVFMRGILNALEDKTDLAEKDFEQAAAFAPQRNDGAIGLGAIYLQQGNSEEAIKLIRRQLARTPNDPSLLSLLGDSLIASGAHPGEAAYGQAQHALEESIKLNSGLCLPHVSLGSIYLQEGRNADAVLQFEAARRIDPNENSAYSHLAVAYRRLGQPEKAREVLAALQALLEQQRSGGRAKALPSSTDKPEHKSDIQ